MLNGEHYCAELVWFVNSVQGKDNVQTSAVQKCIYLQSTCPNHENRFIHDDIQISKQPHKVSILLDKNLLSKTQKVNLPVWHSSQLSNYRVLKRCLKSLAISLSKDSLTNIHHYTDLLDFSCKPTATTNVEPCMPNDGQLIRSKDRKTLTISYHDPHVPLPTQVSQVNHWRGSFSWHQMPWYLQTHSAITHMMHSFVRKENSKENVKY